MFRVSLEKQSWGQVILIIIVEIFEVELLVESNLLVRLYYMPNCLSSKGV